MKKYLGAIAAAAAAGVGVGVGQGLVGVHDNGVVWAQNGAVVRGADEQTIVRTAREARPAVVGISRGQGSGSGVIIRADGVILTNAHVVGTADQVQVHLASGEKPVVGTVIGRDPRVDIAVVRISGNDLPTAPLADSDRIQVGQAAIAIGNPMGLDRTVTAGIVSAVNRSIPVSRSTEGFIQTDAAINPGNSGGALLDSQGRVIGINSMIFNGPGGGLGFAVPINVARDVADQLLKTGKVDRALLGVAYNDVDAEMAAAFKLPVTTGVVVAEVQEGSAAAGAGIQQQDIITRVGDTAIAGGGDLRRALRAHRPGETVSVVVRRGDTTHTLSVRLASAA